MRSLPGALRRLLMAPPLVEVTFAKRGLKSPEPAVARRLEAIPQTVIVGFEAGIEARSLEEVTWRMELLDEELRGFGYEGAAMALTVLDRLVPGGRQRTRELLVGPAARYAFLTYIGIGFAMARLPRARWRGVVPDLTGSPYYPELSWLAVDGYGFDLAFFQPRRWVEQQRRPRPYPWLGAPDYFGRAVDQGIGRALWFLHGARVDEVAAAVGRFPLSRRPDLWSGVGLAATFAGGARAEALERLASTAGSHGPDLAQGAAFAAKARVFAGLVPPHTARAVAVLTGLSGLSAAHEAAAVVDRAVATTDRAVATVDPGATGATAATAVTYPAYEEWRTHVRRYFARVRHAI